MHRIVVAAAAVLLTGASPPPATWRLVSGGVTGDYMFVGSWRAAPGGDREVDMMEISPRMKLDSTGTRSDLQVSTFRAAISCDFLSARRVQGPDGAAVPDDPWFPPTYSGEYRAIQLACGYETDKAQTFATIADALEFTKAHQPPGGPPLVIPAAPERLASVMSFPGRYQEAFRSAQGAMFVDLGSLKRDSADGVTVRVLTVLTPPAGKAVRASLRVVSFDCAKETETQAGQYQWAGEGDYAGKSAVIWTRSVAAYPGAHRVMEVACASAGQGPEYPTVGDAERSVSAVIDPDAPPPPPVVGPFPPLIAKPIWMQKPTDDDFGRAYPPAAKGPAGFGNLECTATATGELEACKVVTEYPRRQGFGAAALSLTRLYRIRETDAERMPVAGRQVRFQVLLIKPTP